MGKGVKADRTEALKWLRLAAQQGSEGAMADYRLVMRRYKRAEAQKYALRIFEVLKHEMESAGQRYSKDRFPKQLDAANHVS